MIGGSELGNRNALPNLVTYQLDINEMFMNAKDPYHPKYQFLINKHEKVDLKNCKDPEAFIEYLNGMYISVEVKSTIQ